MIDLKEQGLLPEVLKFTAPQTVQIGKQTYEVRSVGFENVPGSKGVTCEVFKFTDPKTNDQMDAALITIEPNHSTPIQHWPSSPRIFIEAAVSGRGHWLAINPDGETVCYEFGYGKKEPAVVVYGIGWIGTWIADKTKSLQILEICVPPYEDDGSVLVATLDDQQIAGRSIPLEFRQQYANLRSLPSPSGAL